MMNKSIKVILACGREPSYVRNRQLWRTLQQRFDSQLVGDEKGHSLTFRLARVALQLILQLRRAHDLLVVGFYGHPLVLLAKQFTRAPILFDPFVSTYDTLALDRQAFAADSLFARFCWHLDQQALTKATYILGDTACHCQFYQQTFGLAAEKFATLYLGCDEHLFYPRTVEQPTNPFTVFTYSTYMPLHGVETIIEAAQLCAAYPIRFRLVGDQGPTYGAVQRKAQRLGASNVEFVRTVPFTQLVDEIGQAALCLGGPFGATAKAQRVIAGKSYQFIAMAKPVIIGDTPANQELFHHLETAYLCPLNDPAALAEAILTLYHQEQLRQRLAQNAFTLFRTQLTWSALESLLIQSVEKTLR